jgi:hypothetical protein
MTKILLLNDGDYNCIESVNFPVEVEALPAGSGWDVSMRELIRVGKLRNYDDDYSLHFLEHEVEVL